MKSFLLILLAILLSSCRYSPSSPSPLSATPPSPTLTPTPSPLPRITFGLVGDLGLGRHLTQIARQKNDFNWSFVGISSWLTANDFNLANLESPIITDCPTGYTGTFTFCGDTRFLPILSENKLIFTLANNHIFNYGANGFSQTKNYLSSSQIPFVYSYQSDTEFLVKEINGIKFGFLGYDFITNPKTNHQTTIDTVKKYDSQVDWLIVSIHWGNEYLPQPEKWRVTLAHQLIDAGADIIHGHHPHVWQPPEIYQGKPIFYSFGNFIFDQSWSFETSHSQIARLTLTKNNILAIDYFPIEIKFNSQPWLMSPTPLPLSSPP